MLFIQFKTHHCVLCQSFESAAQQQILFSLQQQKPDAQ